MADNVLWHGEVANPQPTDKEAAAVCLFNARLAQDPRVHLSVIPLGDGLTLALKREALLPAPNA